MKNDIHPKYEVCDVVCACGNTFQTRSTKKSIKVDICSACHPYFTGKQRLTDTEGRVDKFLKKFASSDGKTVERKAKKLEVPVTAPRHLAHHKALEVESKKAAPKAVKTEEKKEEAPAK